MIPENPSSGKGVIEIMKTLNKYVPMKTSSIPHPVMCNGDQLSIERMVDARHIQATSSTPLNRMCGLEPSPQEFHKRCIVLQVGAICTQFVYSINIQFVHRKTMILYRLF